LIHPRFDLAFFFPPRENIMPVIPPKNKPGPVPNPIITKRFVFNKASISSLKSHCQRYWCLWFWIIIKMPTFTGSGGDNTYMEGPHCCGNFFYKIIYRSLPLWCGS